MSLTGLTRLHKILDFLKRYYKEIPEEYITLHLAHKTCIVVYDNKDEVIAFTRWNVDGDTACILDTVIRPDQRKTLILKSLINKGHETFPEVEYISFVRELKYPERKPRKYLIQELLKET
jgi:hypothetical protein